MRRLLLALGVSVLSAAAAHAQSAAGLHFGVAGGITVPEGDDSDFLKNGWNGEALATWNPPVFPLGLRVDAMYARLNNDTERTGERGGVNVVGGTANLVLGFRLVLVKPYLLGGVGYYNVDSSRRSAHGSVSDTQRETGWNAGAGVSISLRNIDLIVEARYHSIGTSGHRFNFVPVSIGLVF